MMFRRRRFRHQRPAKLPRPFRRDPLPIPRTIQRRLRMQPQIRPDHATRPARCGQPHGTSARPVPRPTPARTVATRSSPGPSDRVSATSEPASPAPGLSVPEPANAAPAAAVAASPVLPAGGFDTHAPTIPAPVAASEPVVASFASADASTQPSRTCSDRGGTCDTRPRSNNAARTAGALFGCAVGRSHTSPSSGVVPAYRIGDARDHRPEKPGPCDRGADRFRPRARRHSRHLSSAMPALPLASTAPVATLATTPAHSASTGSPAAQVAPALLTLAKAADGANR